MNYIQELKRKSFHQLSLAIPFGYLIFTKSFVLQVLIPITFIFVIFDIARLSSSRIQKLFLRFFRNVIRPHETHRFTASSYLLLGSVSTIIFSEWLYPKEYAIWGLLFLIVSDTAAALIGRRFGKHKIFEKSIEGTAAFFITSVIIVLLYHGSVPLVHGIVGAFVAAIVELVPLPVDDNFLIPITTCLAIWIVFL